MNTEQNKQQKNQLTDVELMKRYMNRPDVWQSGRVYAHGVIDYV
jgi:hypothetical protein